MAALLGEDPVDDHGDAGSAPERWLSQIELARHLGVHAATIRRWKLPCTMLGRMPRYRVSEVEAYMKTKAFKRRLELLKRERAERAVSK